MRIGIFSESYKPLINGVSTSVETLIAELERAGHTVFVFTSNYPRFTDERPGVFRFPSVNSLVEPDYVLPIPISRHIHNTIPSLKLDLVHSQSPFLLGKMARRIARRFGIPHVSTNHTLYTEYTHYFPLAPPPLIRAFLVRWMHEYYNTCDHVIAPSCLTRDRLVNQYGVRVPIEVVPTGIPEPPYILTSREETKERLGLPANGRVLLYVGRLAPEKNLFMLLDSFVRIAAVVPDAYLVVAGSGKSADVLKKRAQRLGISERTVFTGFIQRTKLDPLYRAAEVFVFPSKTETQGLAVGEALAAGTPCVVVNAGGAPESVHDGVDGFLVEDSADQMAERAILLLQNDDLRHRLSDAARANATLIRPQMIAQRILGIYQRLVHGEARSNAPLVAADDESTIGPQAT
jgi:glycosyltransferase involved in cell wall biosynthesis